jgi:hypothetical protein
VLGDGPLGDDELLRDGRVGAAFRYQLQHLALSRAEPGQRVIRCAAGQQPGGDLRVHRRTAVRHPVHCLNELAAVEHPVLEQVADGAGAVGE